MSKGRTYTFRAPSELGDRLHHVHSMLTLADDDEIDVVRLVGKEFERRLLRARGSGFVAQSQSDAMRLAIELVVGSCEKVAADLQWAELYAEEPPREWEDPDWLEAVFASVDRRRSVA